MNAKKVEIIRRKIAVILDSLNFKRILRRQIWNKKIFNFLFKIHFCLFFSREFPNPWGLLLKYFVELNYDQR